MNFLQIMFNRNTWLWFHMLGGGIIAKILLIWFVPQLAFGITFGIAVVWEIIEMGITNAKEVYGSKKRAFGDAVGDVAGACMIALIVVI